MSEAILAINTGSSSIKFAVYACSRPMQLEVLVRGRITGIGAAARFHARMESGAETASDESLGDADHARAMEYLLAWLDSHTTELALLGAGHRVVHGGNHFTSAVRVDAQVIEALHELIPLAPLHQAHGLHGIEALAAQQPGLPQVACFDTAFHADMPPQETTFALPRTFTQQGIRRYGFHGLSYAYIASVLPAHMGARARVVVAHLGHGVSMCALQNGRSIATTMTFTPLDGLPMGTRSGSLDPAVVLYLLRSGKSIAEVSTLLHYESGLLGMSGISDDMQTLLASSAPAAAEAVDVFCYRISRELGSLAAALQGLDGLVFTGGIGEHAAMIRARICHNANWLGVKLDESANRAGAEDITAADSEVAIRVIPTDEEYMIARESLAVLWGE